MVLYDRPISQHISSDEPLPRIEISHGDGMTEEAMYKAQEVAKYVVGECTRNGKPVDNMKLQKMLYFLWIDYYKLNFSFL